MECCAYGFANRKLFDMRPLDGSVTLDVAISDVDALETTSVTAHTGNQHCRGSWRVRRADVDGPVFPLFQRKYGEFVPMDLPEELFAEL